MQLVVPLSESEIGNVKDGQIATVTVEALERQQAGGSRQRSGDALHEHQRRGQLRRHLPARPARSGHETGMSATAEVVVKQEEGVNVPTTAISADTVTVERDGKQVRQRVVTGLAGNTSTIILSGLKAGETVVLPAASTTSSSASLTSKLGGRAGAAAAWAAPAAWAAADSPGGGGGALLQGRRLMRRPLRSRTRHGRARPRSGRWCSAWRPPATPRPEACSVAHPVIEVHDVTKVFDAGTDPRARAAQRLAAHRHRRSGRDHGQLGQRQEHADEHPRLPGHPHERPLPDRRRGRQPDGRGRSLRPAQPQDRLRLPELQPGRRARARSSTSSCRSPTPGCAAPSAASAPNGRCARWAWATASTTSPPSSRAASSSAWRSRARS